MTQTAPARPLPETPLAAAGASPERPPSPMGEGERPCVVEATRLRSESLEVETTLTAVARLSLPDLGLGCAVALLEGDHLRRLAVLRPAPEQQSLADELLEAWPPLRDDLLGVPGRYRP